MFKLCTYAELNYLKYEWTELFEIELISYIKMDLALNNLQRLICHKTQQTNQPSFIDYCINLTWKNNLAESWHQVLERQGESFND